MNMFDELDRINTVLRNDDILWKLLYYKAESIDDDVLNRPSILSLPDDEKLPIIKLRLKHTPVTNDLADIQICRIIFYQSPRRPHESSYKVARQDVNFDIFVHQEFNDADMRLAKICDRINELMSHQYVSGLGRVEFASGKPFVMANEGYMGYTLVYRFGSVNA